MKKGRPTWWSKVSRPAAERIRAAIAGGDEQRAIFDRFNIQQYGITPRHWGKWYRRILRDLELREEGPSPTERSADAATLLESIIDSMQMSLDAGRTIDSKLSIAMSSVVATMKLDISREADRRADERHKALMKKQAEALEENAEPAGLTDEQLAMIKSKVLGL